jgi:hypothetical protein
MANTKSSTKSSTAATRAEVKRLRSELAMANDEYYNILRCMREHEDRYGYSEAQAARNDATVAVMEANQQVIRNKINALLGKTTAQAA